MKKVDLKTVLIIVLFLLALLFGFMWFFSKNNKAQGKIDKLTDDNARLEEMNKKISEEINAYKVKCDSLSLIDKKYSKEYVILEKQNTILVNKSNAAEKELDRLQNKLYKNRQEIEYLKKHPSNRTGDELINSLKIKTKE